MFIATLFTITRTWKQPKCPLTDEWIKKMWCIYNEISLTHQKEWNNAICSNTDGPSTYHTKWSMSKKERQIPHQFSSVQSLSRVWLFAIPWINRSTPGLPVHHHLPEFTHTHIHRVGVAIQPPHPLSSPSPPAPNPSQHQGLFKWVSSSHQVAKVLEFQLQHQSFQWTPRTDLL